MHDSHETAGLGTDTADPCDPPAGQLLGLSDAQRVTLSEARAVRDQRSEPVRSVQLARAGGAVLAVDVIGDRDQPPFDRAAMDGFAVRSADVQGDHATLRIAGEVAAGEVYAGVVAAGEAVAIMTGAPLPEGADAIQMIERCDVDEGAGVVKVEGPVTARRHVAPRGEDVRAGDVVAPAGRRVAGMTVGVLASVGATSVEVHRRARVAVIATGDELVDIGAEPAAGQIRDSNRHCLMALMQSVGAQVVDGGRAPDDLTGLRAAIRRGLDSDLLLLSGGVSAGRYDLVGEALAAEGVTPIFHKVAIKPGKPVMLARHEHGLVIGLPGNPVSAYVVAWLLAVPAARVIGGLAPEAALPITVGATLSGDLRPTRGRLTFETATLRQDAGELVVQPVRSNGSGDQVGFAGGDCLICRAPDAPAATTGARVDVVLLS